jgi:hypothetical protein
VEAQKNLKFIVKLVVSAVLESNVDEELGFFDGTLFKGIRIPLE